LTTEFARGENVETRRSNEEASVNLNVLTVDDAAEIAESVKRSGKSGNEIAREGKQRLPGATPQVSADDLYTQVLKFVPTPLIGLYLFTVNAALSAFSGKGERVALWVIFGVFTLAIIGFLRTRKVRRGGQIALSVLAFIAWVAASPGPFQAIKDYPEVIGTFALTAVVLAVLVFQLKPLPKNVLEESMP
jgi:hypothetical protein